MDILEMLKLIALVAAAFVLLFYIVAVESGILGIIAAERHLKKHGWCVYPSGQCRTDPDWLLKQPHVQEQLRQCDEFMKRHFPDAKPPQLPFIGGWEK